MALRKINWRANVAETDFDPDDEELAQTPPDVVAVLGFDPKEEIEFGKGCLMAIIPDGELKDKLLAWSAANVPEAVLDPTEGRETEPHLTVLYGFDTGFNTDGLAESLAATAPVTATLGDLKRFEGEEYDVIVIECFSSQLERLNGRIANAFSGEITPSQHQYHPHLTIAYVAKGTCQELDGSRDFAGTPVTFNSFLYSLPGKTGRRVLPLGGNGAKTAARAGSGANLGGLEAGGTGEGARKGWITRRMGKTGEAGAMIFVDANGNVVKESHYKAEKGQNAT